MITTAAELEDWARAEGFYSGPKVDTTTAAGLQTARELHGLYQRAEAAMVRRLVEGARITGGEGFPK